MDTEPTVDRDRLAADLAEYLSIHEGADFGPNGLQVEGRRAIGRLATGVSACLELFERAAAAGAHAVVVHHGLLWGGPPQVLTGPHYRRVACLVRHELSLFAYHLPLDRHPEVGNNALAARALGLVDLVPFAPHEGRAVGVRGRLPEPEPLCRLAARCATLFGQEPLVLPGGDHPVATLGIVSGGAQRAFHEAIETGLDAYLTGEVAEWVPALAREAGVHYLAAGHHATERLGVRALGEHIARRYAIPVVFVDVPNPI